MVRRDCVRLRSKWLENKRRVYCGVYARAWKAMVGMCFLHGAASSRVVYVQRARSKENPPSLFLQKGFTWQGLAYIAHQPVPRAAGVIKLLGIYIYISARENELATTAIERERGGGGGVV